MEKPASQTPPAEAGPPLLLDQGDGIGSITLNRPAGLNLLTGEMIDSLQLAFDTFSVSREVRVVVLGAAGRAFCAGHDLKALADAPKAEVNDLFTRCEEVMAAIRQCPKPVIAMVQGTAAAAGCQLVATCDLVMASSEARFGTTGIKAGLFCSVPMVPLSRVVPARKALEMLLTGDTISAEEAERIGLVNHVVAPAELAGAARALANRIAGHSPYAIALGKQGFYRQIGQSYEAAYALGKANMVANAVAPDGREGIKAFLEKREPTWEE